MNDTEKRITELLLSTEREGIGAMIAYLRCGGFFKSPASTRWHGVYEGGLADHSLAVCEMLVDFDTRLKLGAKTETITIATFLHDVCKMGAYIGSGTKYKWNLAQPKGHAKLSLERIKKYIVLTPIEEMMIKYHMGLYGLNEFDEKKGEYPLRGGGLANVWNHFPIVKVMYFCDELCTLEGK